MGLNFEILHISVGSLLLILFSCNNFQRCVNLHRSTTIANKDVYHMSIKVQDFFKPVHLDENIKDSDYESIKQIIEIVKSLSEVTYQTIYLVDYYRRNFLYVSDNPFFLSGSSAK